MPEPLCDRPPFVVWRAAPGVPPRFMPAGMEGRWDHRPEPMAGPFWQVAEPMAVAIRTRRIEHRDDGASAEVWEVHPARGNYDPDPAERLPLW